MQNRLAEHELEASRQHAIRAAQASEAAAAMVASEDPVVRREVPKYIDLARRERETSEFLEKNARARTREFVQKWCLEYDHPLPPEDARMYRRRTKTGVVQCFKWDQYD